MRVRATCTLKNSLVGMISTGTIFEGTEETLPEFVLTELKRDRGTFEVLVDVTPAKKKAPRKRSSKLPVQAKAEVNPKGQQEEKPVTLREKLTISEK